MTEDLRKAAEAVDEALPGMEWFAQMDRFELIATPVGSTCISDQIKLALCATNDKAGKVVAYLAAAQPTAILALYAERDAAIARAEEADERAHYATGTADLAMQHRDAAEASLAAVTAERDAMRIALQRLESAASSMLVGVGVHNDRHIARGGSRIEGPVVSELADAARNAGVALKEPTNAE